MTSVGLRICNLSLAVAIRRMVKTPIAAFSTGRTYKQNYLYVTAINENRFLFLCLFIIIIIIVTFSTEIYKLNRLITNSMAYRFIHMYTCTNRGTFAKTVTPMIYFT